MIIYYLLSVVSANLQAINDFVCITRLSQFHFLISMFVYNSLSIVNSPRGTYQNFATYPSANCMSFVLCGFILIWLCFLFQCYCQLFLNKL